MKLIDKDALLAEIEKVIDEPAPSHDQQCPWEDGYYGGLYKAENVIENLEVKEVDFGGKLTWKEMAEIVKIANLLEIEWLNNTPWDGIRDWGFYTEVLKRFKEQKGE